MTLSKALLVAGGLALALTPQARAQHPQVRDGLWGGFGIGFGSLGCEECDERSTSFSGYGKIGGTVSRKVLIGFEASGWVKEEDGATLSMSNGSAVIYFYPSLEGGLHLKGGLGVSVLELSLDFGGGTLSDSETGGGGMLGIGYDIRVARNMSLTPGLNFLGGSFDGGSANFWQLVVGLTWH